MKKIITLITMIFLLFSISVSANWANADIEFFASEKYAPHIDFKNLDPNAPIKRSDAINLLLGVVLSPELIGVKDGLFSSNVTIYRSDFAQIVYEALKLEKPLKIDVKFKDHSKIFYQTAICSAVNAGFLNGFPDGNFKPYNELTNAEAFTIAKRILDKYKNTEADKLEIERKFVIDPKNIPYDLGKAEKFDIVQTYINKSPEIRVRKLNESYYTFGVKLSKDDVGLSRKESEFIIDEYEYDYLIAKKEFDSIEKTRYQFDFEGYFVAVDIYSGKLSGLAVAEIEFDNKDEADKFKPFDWFGKDVTADKRYKNAGLAEFGIPKD